MATREYNGDYINHTPSSAVSAGDVVVLTNIIGVADSDIAANALGSIAVKGVYLIAKDATEAMTDGQKLYWSVANSNVTTTVGANLVIGYAVGAGAEAATTQSVLLGQ